MLLLLLLLLRYIIGNNEGFTDVDVTRNDMLPADATSTDGIQGWFVLINYLLFYEQCAALTTDVWWAEVDLQHAYSQYYCGTLQV